MDGVRQDIINLTLGMKALIQDIQSCDKSLDKLNELNSEGRRKLLQLRKSIQLQAVMANEEEKIEKRKSLLLDVKSNEEQLSSILTSFQKANLLCLLEIDKCNRNELLGSQDEEEVVRNRKKRDRENLVKDSGLITDQLLSISRNLSDITHRSGETLETLANTTTGINSTREELENTGGVIAQSGKLLAKYGRRERTDKVLVLFAFAFFLACCFYVIQKRLF